MGALALAIVLLVAVASFSSALWTQSPTHLDPVNRLQSPSAAHWFGTDNFGRDVFSRVVAGGQASLIIGLIVTLGTALLGVAAGLSSGFYSRVDMILMRLLDGLMAFPAILLAIAMVAAMGASLFNEVIALSIVYFPRVARVVRAATLQLKQLPFVEAAQAIGAGEWRILMRHVLQNALTPLIVQATFIFAEAILADASLSFLGLGVQPPQPTWGNILGDSQPYLSVAPWFSVAPGLAIVVTVLSLNLVGDTIRDMLDPRSAHRATAATPAAVAAAVEIDEGEGGGEPGLPA